MGQIPYGLLRTECSSPMGCYAQGAAPLRVGAPKWARTTDLTVISRVL